MLPTGAGKTVIFSEIVRLGRLKYGNSLQALILNDRIKLVNQTTDKIVEIAGCDVNIYCGSIEKSKSNGVTSASIQTLMSDKNEWRGYQLVIIDEAHNYMSANRMNFVRSFEKENPNAKFIWFTATPWRSDYHDEGMIWGDFGIPVKKPSFKLKLNDLISANHLVRPCFTSTKNEFDTSSVKMSGRDFLEKDLIHLTENEEIVMDQVKDALSRLQDKKKIIWACTCIKHAELVRDCILKYEVAITVHSKQKNPQQSVKDFEDTDVRHLTSVTIVAEGYDYPKIDAIIIMRPTRSPKLYVQLIGRGLRLFQGKENCLVLDYGGAVRALGDPNDPYVKPKGARRNSSEANKSMECEGCKELIFRYPCRGCGHVKKVDLGSKIKSLSRTSDTKTFVAIKDSWQTILKYEIKDHVSKAGNECKKIEYITISGKVIEYFPNFKMDMFNHRRLCLEGSAKEILIGKENGYKVIKGIR